MASRTALNRLTTAKLKHGLEPHRRYSDGGGLWLQVSKSGTRSWLFRYIVDSRVRWHGLGGYPEVSLAQARQLAEGMRGDALKGVDLIAEKRVKKLKGKTFSEFAAEYIKTKSPGWKNPKHRQQWTNTLTTYAYPVIGHLPLNAIELSHIDKILNGMLWDGKTLWEGKTETATRVRSRIENILDAAKVKGHRTGDNPARWRANLKHVLPEKGLETKNHPAMLSKDIPDFMAKLRTRNSTSARALEFTILTAVRTGATIGATWAEFDLDAKLWTVSPDRAGVKITGKDRKPKVTMLSDRAIEILKMFRGKPQPDGAAYVFPGDVPNEPLSNMALLELLRGMLGKTKGVTVHGFRATFKTWSLDQAKYPGYVSEFALWHTVKNKTEASYIRDSAPTPRALLMTDWANYCASASAKSKGVATSKRTKGRA
jgi:integrase